VQKSRSTLHALATVLQASPESDALVILGRLLDSLPIGFYVSDCDARFHVLYANRVWENWLAPGMQPVVGKTLAELLPSAEQAGVLDVMREVRATAQARHLKGFEFRELGNVERGKRGETSQWDWEIYPLSGPTGVTHLLNVVMDVSAPRRKRDGVSTEVRQVENSRREAASGVLRIFGLAPDADAPTGRERLSKREDEVSELLAMGFTNGAIADHLEVSSATIASHVAHILSKLRFRSRAQVAAWVVGRRLGRAVDSESAAGAPAHT
jgi:DNA-binding CsgD family transcriptional regulator/PAS domain-containing protein